MRRVLFWASACLFAGGVTLFGFAGAATAAHFGHGAMAIEVGGGTSASVIAVMCALTCRRERRDDDRYRQLDGEYRRREAVLIKTVARLSGYPTPTQPLPHLRPVRR